MKIAVFFFLISGSLFAAVPQYNVKLDIAVEGKKHSSPNLVIKEGETATIFETHGSEENFVEVEALPYDNETIKMKMVVGKIGPNGERIILSQPEIKSSMNQEAKFVIGDKSGEKFSLSAIAKKKVIE